MKLVVAFFGLVSAFAMSSTPAAPRELPTGGQCMLSSEPGPESLVCWQNANGASCCCFQTQSGLFCQGGGCLSTP